MIETPRRSARRLSHASLLLAACAVVLFSVYAVRARPADALWGDESTYLAMATSLARDGDMKYTEADRRWAVERAPGALILQRTDGGDSPAGLGYSKPIVYPLLAAPFVRLFGEPGMLICNLVLVSLALALAWDYLFRFGDRVGARATWITFVVACPIVPYLFWRMSESAQVALALAGLVLSCRDLRFSAGAEGSARTRLSRVVVGGILLGLLVALRLPNLIVAAAPVAAWAVHRRPKPFLALLAAVTLTFFACTGLTHLLTGSANPYRAVRTSFDARTGYPDVTAVGAPGHDAQEPAPGALAAPVEAVEPLDRFESDPATHRAYWRLLPEWRRTAYATLFAFIGRHTGLLFYFPALWVLGATLRRPDRLSTCLMIGAAGLLGFYLLWLPGNYFGGSTFIGNRYWLAGYPLVLVALPRLPSTRTFLLGWALACAIGVSVLLGLLGVDHSGTLDGQAHARRGIFRWLPVESQATMIDGWRARRWSGDVLRFMDLTPEIGERGFTLAAGDRPVEVELARAQRDRLLFAVRADGAGALEIRDWRHRETVSLTPFEATLVSFEPAAAWRRHPTVPGPVMQVYGLEFRFAAPEGRVEVRYLGTGVDRETALRVRRAALPDSGFAGSTLDGWIAVENQSSWDWSSEGVLPVYLGYRFEPVGGGDPIEGPALPLSARIVPGATLRMPFEIVLPAEPGSYVLTVDLEEDLFGPFTARLGEPLARRTVAVGSLDSERSAPRSPD